MRFVLFRCDEYSEWYPAPERVPAIALSISKWGEFARPLPPKRVSTCGPGPACITAPRGVASRARGALGSYLHSSTQRMVLLSRCPRRRELAS
jgi:hypothetical protein